MAPEQSLSTLTDVVPQTERTPKPYPIVFVHGAWHAAWCWQEHFLPYFAQHGYTVHTPNLRQHGGVVDTRALRRCRLDDYVADLAATVAALEGECILVGHSMGGLVVQKYLERASAKAAMLLAPVPIHGALGATLRTMRRIPWHFLKANLQLRLYPLIENEELARDAFFSPDIEPPQLKAYFARLQDESYLAFLDMVIFRLPRPKRINTPILVLGAEDDAIFRPAEIQRTARAYGSEAQIFPNMAHDMMLERDWQAVANTMRQWLQHQGL